MNQDQIREKMHEIQTKMAVLEWDRRVSNTSSKDYLFKELKEEYGKLESQLNTEITKKE